MKAKRAVRLILQARLSDARLHAPGVRTLDEEAVHDMRVAVRRLRACLAAVDPGRVTKRARRADRSLKSIQDGLGAVRDLQLHLLWLRRARGAPFQAARALSKRARVELRAARAQLLDALGDWERVGDRRVERAIEGVAPQGRFDRRVARRALRAPLRELGATIARLSRAVDPEAAHQIRILGKKIRYAAELYEPADRRVLRPVRLGLERLQGVLGSAQDAHARAERLRASLADASPRVRRSYEALARLAEEEEEEAAAAADQELRRWRRERRARRLCERLEEGS
jgi:CHAD domain-containing protein